MENTRKLTNSILLLVVIFGAIGWILSAQSQTESVLSKTSELTQENTVLTLVGKQTVKSQRAVIVTDRYVNTLDENDKVITIGTNGEMYNVKSGTVLADNMIIKKTNEESSNVRLHQLRNSAVQHSFN